MYKMVSAKKAIKANLHHIKMMKDHKEDILLAIRNTKEYPESKCFSHTIDPRYAMTESIVVDKGTTHALYSMNLQDANVAVLNYASYVSPGGRFLEGSKAQEEALCHESYLFEVLNSFKPTIYTRNLTQLRQSLYGDDLLYTKHMMFRRGDSTAYADVITCAAPNANTFRRKCEYADVKYIRKKLYETMVDRAYAILYAAYINHADVLILGAFGCGVFGNNPEDVASIFNDMVRCKFQGAFKTVIYAIPDSNSANYIAFNKVINKKGE